MWMLALEGEEEKQLTNKIESVSMYVVNLNKYDASYLFSILSYTLFIG